MEQELQYADAFNGTDKDWFPNTLSPLQNAFNTIISCLTLLSNGLVITVMLVRRRVFGSLTNRLILHQSVIDAITGVVFFLHVVVKKPNAVVSFKNPIYDELFCRLIYSDALLLWLYLTSTYNLVIISLERFMATCYPVKYRNSWSKSKVKKLALATPWAIGFVYTLFVLLSYEEREGFCQLAEISQGLAVFQGIFMAGTEYVLPVVIIIYAYTKALFALTKKLSNPVTARQAFLQKARRNLLTTTLLAGVMFIVCWTPSEIYLILLTVDSENYANYIIYVVCTALISLNMCVNPIIYCFQYKHFRCQLMEMLFRRNRVHALGEEPPPPAIDPLQRNTAGPSGTRSGIHTITARLPQICFRAESEISTV